MEITGEEAFVDGVDGTSPGETYRETLKNIGSGSIPIVQTGFKILEDSKAIEGLVHTSYFENEFVIKVLALHFSRGVDNSVSEKECFHSWLDEFYKVRNEIHLNE